MKQTAKKFSDLLLLFAILLVTFVTVDVLFLLLARNEAKTIALLKQELKTLEQNARIITSAQELLSTYQAQIDQISNVFPSEETFPQFIQELESHIRAHADEYSLKFSSVIPLTEQDRLFLPLTLTMKTDLGRLLSFLATVENLPYMTHVSSLVTKTPEGFSGVSEVTVSLKVYVQNPFTAQ